MNLERIKFTDLEGFSIGNAQDFNAFTGVTALVFTKKNICGIDISGGGPAARESYLFSPLSYEQSVTALLLSGGSAYGLSAATGAMQFLEERGMGYKLGELVVPIVPQSCIFDLGIGSSKIRPDAVMGYKACEAALDKSSKWHGALSGTVGGGTGATIGKIYGMERSQKSGIGYAAFKVGTLKIGAIVVVNALGDIFDYTTAKKIGGALTPDRKDFCSVEEALYLMQQSATNGTNTTIGAVITNASLTQQELCKLASMTRSGLGRSINPVGTTADGDTMYAISTGGVKADVNVCGTLACKALSEAIIDAVNSSRMEDAEYLAAVKAVKEN